MPRARDLLIAAAALALLPFALTSIGLGVTSATEVVVFAIACMALNILVGYTGLTSFGHGAWFGLAAYAAGLAQLKLFPGSIVLPVMVGFIVVALASLVFGYVILRRRGVYFSLLALALAAMLYTVAFRGTGLTRGENELGGITRPVIAGVSFDTSMSFYALVASVGLAVVYALWRFHRSPVGQVLVAIRENETRARFIGYQANHYKLLAFVVSATITGLAGTLLLFNNRMTSADPISVAFSGELLAMVIIGGMRSFLGPALGALFFVIFRDYLSGITENWLLFFGLLFVAFVVLSPTGLVGLGETFLRPFKTTRVEKAAMASRQAGAVELPAFLKPKDHRDGAILKVEGIAKSFGGIRAVRGVSFALEDRSLHALIGPNGAGKTTAFNVISGMYAPDAGTVTLAGRPVGGLTPGAVTQAGIGRSFQITNLFPALTVAENVRLAVQSRDPKRFNFWTAAESLDQVNRETAEMIRTMGLAGIERVEAGSLSYGGQRLLDMALALATKPRVLLLVEHDIDRVFQLADAVTVMNDGQVLVDGTVEDARSSSKVQEVYIGSGTHALAGKARPSAARPQPLLVLDGVNTLYGKSHILRDVAFDVREQEIVALLGRNGAGKSTVLKTIVGIAPPARGAVSLAGEQLAGRASAEITRRGISYVPQGRGLFAGMSVAENMELGHLRRRNNAGAYWDEDKIFAFFPRIKERWRSPADYLSGGEQQMVAVARALSGDTRVLLLDEPFEGLAPAVIEELFEAFDRLRHEVSILIVDHHLDLALALSDRTVALERGEVAYRGPSKALSEDLDLRRKVLWL